MATSTTPVTVTLHLSGDDLSNYDVADALLGQTLTFDSHAFPVRRSATVVAVTMDGRLYTEEVLD